MTTRASIILWSTGGGALLGLFVDALLVGLWMIGAAIWPGLLPRPLPRWASVAIVVVLAAIPTVAALLGFLEGRLKTD